MPSSFDEGTYLARAIVFVLLIGACGVHGAGSSNSNVFCGKENEELNLLIIRFKEICRLFFFQMPWEKTLEYISDK